MAQNDFTVVNAKINISVEDIQKALSSLKKVQGQILTILEAIAAASSNERMSTGYKRSADAAREAASASEEFKQSAESAAKATAAAAKQATEDYRNVKGSIDAAAEAQRQFEQHLDRARQVRMVQDVNQAASPINQLRLSYKELIQDAQAAGQANVGFFKRIELANRGITGLLGAVKNIQAEVNLAFAETSDQYNTVGKAALGLRQIIFGLKGPSEQTSGALRRVGSVLNFIIERQVDVNKTTNQYAAIAVSTAQQVAQANRAIPSTLKEISDAAKVLGINGSSDINRISQAANEAANRFDEIVATLQKGGKVDKGFFTAQQKAVVQLTNNFKNLEAKGIIPTTASIDALEKQLNELGEEEAEQAAELRRTIANQKRLRDEYNKVRDILQTNENAIKRIGLALDASAKNGGKATTKIAGFIRGLFKPTKQAEDGMHGLGTSFLTAGRSADDFSQRTNAAVKTVQTMGRAVVGVKDIMLGTFAGNVLFSITSAITRPFQAGIAAVQNFVRGLQQEFFQANNLVQNFEVTLKQMLTGFDEETVSNALVGAQELIRKVIAKTPFELATGQEAFQQLITGGLDPREWLEPAADAAAAFNKPMQQLVFAIQRLKAGSKGIGIDMIRDFGIPVQQVGVWVNDTSGAVLEFSEVAGKTDEELKASGATFKQWAFDAQGSLEQTPIEAIEILNGYLRQNATIAGGAAARSRTLTGVMSNLKDSVTSLLVAFGSPIFSAITDILSAVYQVVNELMTVLEPFAKVIGEEVANALRDWFLLLTGIESRGNATLGWASEAVDGFKAIAASILQFAKPALQVILAIVEGDFDKAWALFLQLAKNAIEGLSRFLQTTGRDAFKWGVEFISMIAKGITYAATSALKYAVQGIGYVISSFLKPGSPPEQGPLSTINTWGAGLMQTFADGFKLPDLDFLKAITEPIQETLLSLGGTNVYKKVRSNIIKLIGGINQTGAINEDLWKQVQGQLKGVSQTTKEYIRLQLELKAVTKEVTDAEKAGFIPKELQEKLEAAQLAVALKEEEVKLEEQQKQASKAGGAGGTGTSLEDIKKRFKDEEKLLRDKYKLGLINEQEYLNALKSLNLNFSEELLKAGKKGDAKDKLKNARELDEKIFKNELEMLEKRRDLGLVTEEEYLSSLEQLQKKAAEDALARGDESLAKERIAEAKDTAERIEEVRAKTQEEELLKQIEKERKILELKYKKGLITEEEYRDGLLKIQENYVDQSLDLGIVDENEIAKLKQMKEELAASTQIPIDKPAEILASFAEDVTGEFQTLVDSIRNDFNTALGTTWEDVSNTFMTSFGPIWDEIKLSISESLRGIFGTAGVGSISDFLTRMLDLGIQTINNRWAGPGGIQENLGQKINDMWAFLSGDTGPLANAKIAFNRITLELQNWINDPANQEKLTQLGASVGQIIIDGVVLLFSGPGPEEKVNGALRQTFVDSLLGFVHVMTEIGQKWLQGLLSSFLPESLAKATSEILLFFVNFSAEMAGAILQPLHSLNKIVEIITGIANNVQTIVNTYFGSEDALVPRIIKFFTDTVARFFQTLYNVLVGNSIVPETVNAILNWVDILKDGFVGRIEELKDSVIEIFDNIKDKIEGVIEQFNILKDLKNPFAGGDGEGGGFDLPFFNKGTLKVPETGPAVIHKDEAVLPVSTANAFRALVDMLQTDGFGRIPISSNPNLANIGTTNSKTIQINNPVFPGITTSKDAGNFLKNLDREIRMSELRGTA